MGVIKRVCARCGKVIGEEEDERVDGEETQYTFCDICRNDTKKVDKDMITA